VHALQPCYPVDRHDFCNYYLQSIHDDKIDPELTFLLTKLDFYMNAHVNMQNNRYWFTESQHLLHKIPHNNVKGGVWCALSGKRITGPILFMETNNSKSYVR
jgi:hypothetical protein